MFFLGLLMFICLLGIPVTFIGFIVQFIRKKSNKKMWGITNVLMLVGFIASVSLYPAISDEDSNAQISSEVVVENEDVVVGTPSPSPSKTPSPSPVETVSPSPSKTPSPSPVETASPVASKTPSPSPVETASPVPSETPSPSPVETATPTPSTSLSGSESSLANETTSSISSENVSSGSNVVSNGTSNGETTADQKNQSAGSGDGSNFNTYNNVEQQNTSADYVLNTKSKKIHYPGCKSVPKISPNNYATSNLSVEELRTQGYSTCGNCFN